MILADKIIRLRKKNGWSQEELADKMNVSRQAVSKWEGAQTIPDLEKILQLSILFGVTTDYLLKDEIENEELTSDTSSDTTVKRISIEEATAYIIMFIYGFLILNTGGIIWRHQRYSKASSGAWG